MLANKNQISLRQALLLFLNILFSSSIRFIPSITSQKAKQAAWLTPLPSLIILVLFILMLHNIYKKYSTSFINIMYSITGKTICKILLFIYIIWFQIPIALFLRYYVERILTSIFPNVSTELFLILLLLLIVYILPSGIVVIARMNEIISIIIFVSFLSIVVLAIPKIEISNLTPISYMDIIPILKGSISIIPIWSYLIYIFFIGDEIKNKEKIKKLGLKTAVFLSIATSILIATCVGALGYSVVERAPLPFLSVSKIITVFETLGRVHSILVVLWVTSDFILISTFIYILLKMIKSFLNLKTTKPFINIYAIFLYFFTLLFCNSKFELEVISSKIKSIGNILFGLIIPVAIFIIGKFRRKV
ncbi:endospore germination permease [Clostridium cochlearium]|uniref:GerAB/ArcD/ProY family transporter n=1 Tax=Clostridium cochlearium TaxID=1494 RepID=UPI001844DC9F|nr:endospore germination permease [Clostridium cochlearium]NMA58889.1 endospore germination permease [Clostridium cochlearium]